MSAGREINDRPIVLIANEDVAERKRMRDSLQRIGFNVDEAENGIEALSKFKEFPPDALLLDATMPVMDGYKTCKALRKMPKGRMLPIVMITAPDEEDSFKRAYEAGASSFVTRPLDLTSLSYQIGCILRLNRDFADLIKSMDRMDGHIEYLGPEKANYLTEANRNSVDAADMSHKLRTTLNSIIGFSKLLIKGVEGELNKDQIKSLAFIYNSGKQLLDLVDDILDARPTVPGKLKLKKNPFDLNRLIEEIYGIFIMNEDSDRPVLLECAVGETAKLSGDVKCIKQVLFHLFSDAVKAAKAGPLWFKVEELERSENDVLLRFNIQTGAGVVNVKTDASRDASSELESNAAPESGCKSLASSSCKKLVQLMGGDMGRSMNGEGTSFWCILRFPFAGDAATRADHTKESPCDETFSPKSKKHEGQTRVLLVEDNLANRLLAERILENLGCRIDVAESGQEALKKASENDYNIIFMDCQIPEINGYEATSEIRKMEKAGKRTPIIAMTASVMEEEKEMCFRVGMDDFLAKPISPGDFIEIVERWGGKARKKLRNNRQSHNNA